MKKREKNKLLTVMMSFMFITIMSLVIMPLTANAQTAHTAHFRTDKDGWAHEGWNAISNKDDLYSFCVYGGNGYLTADIEIDGFLVVYSDCEVNLCLNGHKIIQTGDYSVISLNEGSKLNLYDESNNTGIITHISESEGSALYMYKATFTMYGGRIANNICDGAGGAIYSENSTIVMNGGIISKNKADAHGGAIYAEKSDVTINQGNVEKNSLVYGGYGGGLYVIEGTLTINGGNISKNFATYGAGIAADESTVTINGGNISGNTSYNQGGGIYTCFSSLTINGGEFSGNSATEEGGGLYGIDSAIVMNDGLFSENNANRGGGLYIRQYANEELFRIEGGDISDNKAEIGDGVYVISEGLIVDGIVKDSIYCYLNTNDECNYYSVNFDPNKGTGKTYTQYYLVVFLEDSEDFDDYFKRYLAENRFTRSGYEFYNWNTEADGSGISYVDGAEIKTEDSSLTLYAQWIPNKYTVKYNANGGSGTMSSQSVKSNSSITLNANTFTRQGYEFAGWNTKANGSGTSYVDGENTEIIVLNTNKITLYAQWKASTDTPYKVEHYKQKLDGTYNKKASEAYELTGTTDTSVTPEVKTYKGFTSPVTKTEKIKADGSLVIKYYYERNSYTLTWNLAGGTADGAYSSGLLKYQEKITAPVPTRTGYTFNGWKTEVPEKMPAKNLTIKATWKANADTKYTVEHYKQKVDGTYPATASESESLKGKTNASVIPEVKTYKGFTSPDAQTVKVKADGSLVVKYYYTRNSYKLTWDFAGGSAKGSYTKGNVKYGAKITAPVPTRDGYEFTGWDKTVASKMPANDVTYKAKWRKLSQKEQVTAFVERFYTIILDRPAEAAGLADWTNRLISKQATGADVAAGFINSGEFQKKKMTDEEYVTKLYRAFFDREPDKEGYNNWLRELKNGKSRDYVLRGFIGSPEFDNLCKKYGINTGSY